MKSHSEQKLMSDSALVDEKYHVYLGNKQFIDDMEECKLLDAWFDILAENCAKWSKGEKINYSEFQLYEYYLKSKLLYKLKIMQTQNLEFGAGLQPLDRSSTIRIIPHYLLLY